MSKDTWADNMAPHGVMVQYRDCFGVLRWKRRGVCRWEDDKLEADREIAKGIVADTKDKEAE